MNKFLALPFFSLESSKSEVVPQRVPFQDNCFYSNALTECTSQSPIYAGSNELQGAHMPRPFSDSSLYPSKQTPKLRSSSFDDIHKILCREPSFKTSLERHSKALNNVWTANMMKDLSDGKRREMLIQMLQYKHNEEGPTLADNFPPIVRFYQTQLGPDAIQQYFSSVIGSSRPTQNGYSSNQLALKRV